MSERREGVQRAPRSGGRTTEQRGTPENNQRTATNRSTGSEGGVRGARRHPARDAVSDIEVQGTAALKLNVAEPLRESDGAPWLRVAPSAPINAPRVSFAAAVIVLVVVGVFGILLINTKASENTFEIAALEDQKAVLDNQEQQLRRTIAGFENTGSLDAAARMLGLVKSESPAYIRLPDGRVIGVPTPATAKPSITSQNAGPVGTAPAAGG